MKTPGVKHLFKHGPLKDLHDNERGQRIIRTVRFSLESKLLLNEAGLAKRFQLLWGDVIRYVHNSGKWLAWKGQRWEKTQEPWVRGYMDDLVDILEKEKWYAIDESNDQSEDGKKRSSIIKKYNRAIFSMGQSSRRTKILREFANSVEISIGAEELDEHLHVLGCPNGLIDLKTGEILDKTKEMLVTKSTSVRYNANAECPNWRKFLYEIFAEDKDMVDFMQRVLGYALTGSNREQLFFLLYGAKGSNGKSTFIETVSKIMGNYATSTPSTTFVDRKDGSIPNDLARLKGTRLVMASESGEQKPLNAPLVKQLTGNDAISARFMYKEWFTYIPQFIAFFVTNYRPQVTASDPALWRRMVLVDFKCTFVDDVDGSKLKGLAKTKHKAMVKGKKVRERNRELPGRLTKEHEGILAWMVEGACLWHSEGSLSLPDAVVKATKKYREDMDVMTNFLEECTEYATEAESCSVTDLWACWVAWTKSNNERTGAKRWFSIHMKRRGYIGERKTVHKVQQRVWLHLKIRQ